MDYKNLTKNIIKGVLTLLLITPFIVVLLAISVAKLDSPTVYIGIFATILALSNLTFSWARSCTDENAKKINSYARRFFLCGIMVASALTIAYISQHIAEYQIHLSGLFHILNFLCGAIIGSTTILLLGPLWGIIRLLFKHTLYSQE